MSELSGHNCPRCNVELFIEASGEVDGVDLLICKQCWGVAVTAKSMQMVMPKGVLLDEKKDQLTKTSGDCKCPMCSEIMDEIELEIPKNVIGKISLIESQTMTAGNVIIDSCKNCPTFWFDVGELDLLNGIKPKIRKNDPEAIRLLEDQTLSQEDLSKKLVMRRMLGGVSVLFALMILMNGDNGAIAKIFSIIIGIGGLIAISTRNPEQSLAKGTCDKCLKPEKLLAWNCQRGGCWAHICNDCQGIGDDPVEAYAKTLGKVAVGAVIVGVGVGVVIATEGSVGGGLMEFAGGIVLGEDEENSMLLCRECTERENNNLEKTIKKPLKPKSLEKKDMSESSKESRRPILQTTWSPEIKNEYCKHIDSNNNKKCKRMSFRKGNYCYAHKDLY